MSTKTAKFFSLIKLHKEQKILVDSGSLAGQTFIDRYDKAVSVNARLYKVGRGKRFNYLKKVDNIWIISFSSELDKIIQISLCLLLGLRSASWYSKLFIYASKGATRREKIRRLYKGSLVLSIRPKVIHIQWVKNLSDWEWIFGTGIKLTVSLRGSQINVRPKFDSSLGLFYSLVFPKVNRFHAVSEDIARNAYGLGARKNQIHVIYSGLDLDSYQFKNKSHEPSLKILSVGRDHWVKGFNYALKAMKIINDSNLDFYYSIVGVGLSNELAFLVDEYQLSERVFLREQMNHFETLKLIGNSDILLLPSVSEGIANVAIEAMAMGTAVISADVGGMKELIQHGETGFLVSMRDPLALGECIKFVHSLSTSDLEIIKRNARLSVENKFALGTMTEKFKEFYSF